MMNIYELQRKLEDFRRLPKETEWIEFKHNNEKPVEIGEYISAISNGAVLKGKRFGYLVWGIEDKAHRIVEKTRVKKTRVKPRILTVKHENSPNRTEFRIKVDTQIGLKWIDKGAGS